jgi:hypothetical protein
MKKIVFFDAKPYDREFFDAANTKHGYEIKYIGNWSSADIAPLVN